MAAAIPRAARAGRRAAARKNPCANRRRLVGCALDDCQGYDAPLGAVAQLVEHYVRNVGVEGSNPFCSTKCAHLLNPRWGSEVANRSRL